MKDLEVMLVCGGMDDDIINVDDDVVDSLEDFLHESFERRRTTQKSHWGGYLFELALSLDGEGCEVAVFLVDGHLPESGSEVDGGEDGRVGSADVGDALINLFYGVLVGVGLCVKASEVLNNPESSPTFLGNTEDWRVVSRSGSPNHSQA